MTRARASQVELDVTPYYHCISRCVRRAFLCGQDRGTGRNFDHRKEWFLERLARLTEVFAIDLCAYAVMSNHVHLVLHVDRERGATWQDADVVERARGLYPSAFSDWDTWSQAKRRAEVARWRERLSNISWFMRSLSEHIARRANREDDCTGRFWEGRFRSQALLDDGALLACMSYVDLNPVRAGVAQGLEDSEWTSIAQRLREASTSAPVNSAPDATTHVRAETSSDKVHPSTPRLASFCEKNSGFGVLRTDDSKHEPGACLPMTLIDYAELLEWTGRALRPGKAGHITAPPARLLVAAGIEPSTWSEALRKFGQFSVLVGSPDKLREHAPQFARRWVKGQLPARSLYRCAA